MSVPRVVSERAVPGIDLVLVQAGCAGEQMEEVTRTGEYILVCQKDAEE